MLKKVQDSKILFWTLELLALAVLVIVVSQMNFILEPIGKFFSSIFIPVIISGFLTYLLLPFVRLLKKIKLGKRLRIPHLLAVLIVLVIFLVILVMAFIVLIPNLITQVSRLLETIPYLMQHLQKLIEDASRWPWVRDFGLKDHINDLQKQFSSFTGDMVQGAANSLATLIGTMTTITITAVTVPVMTFYMLNDGNKLVPSIQRFFPAQRRDNVADIFGRLNKTISQYITGQVIEMAFVGFFTTIGYLMIGQKYALLLGVIAGITNLIPYVGPYIGIVPAIFVAAFQGPWQVVWTIVVVIIVQQVDGNLLYPRIMGASLKIHPLTIIIILLAAGNIAGIGGMILAIPMYAIVRTLAVYAWELWHLSDQDVKQS
ncbi:transporter [Weissella oryzae SG25]|uniref:Transporter n=1 Tax=Weissella oryzae (strain DSM 25784 / JCM 18191 / LMG 30913 / SG25) TaxID=1329250 RepID=A0A069CRU9_WEIOS|nr:AI-2E family transporter [Weissella oryzae]GAK30107.1 transporter [Weissella oryzae SG25]